jgi:predicted DNA-binding transcriptional regulator AlpA
MEDLDLKKLADLIANKIIRGRAPQRGKSRIEAADYIGVSPSLFDEMVQDGRAPRPFRINTRVIWDVRDLDVAIDALKGEPDEANSWDEM